jgi:SAM-dependent methyltransferase
MQLTDFWAIIERDHSIQNPITIDKLMLLADYCQVDHGMRVLDLGCGKGTLLRTWATHWQIQGTGIDINPHFLAEARQQAQAQGVHAQLSFVETPAREFSIEASYDIVTNIGAIFALGTLNEAAAWMRRAVQLDGMVALGTSYLTETLPDEFLREEMDVPVTTYSLSDTVADIEAQDLDCVAVIAASHDDLDRYASLCLRAARLWARTHVNHPARADLLRGVAAAHKRYLRWERRYFGWAVIVAMPR